jgi:hypothetical protein
VSIHSQTDRRLFLKFLGLGLTGFSADMSALGPLATTASTDRLPFTPIKPRTSDEVVLPPEFRYETVALCCG